MKRAFPELLIEMPRGSFPKWMVDLFTNHEKRLRKIEAALGVKELSIIRLASETKKREDVDRSSSYPDVDEEDLRG